MSCYSMIRKWPARCERRGAEAAGHERVGAEILDRCDRRGHATVHRQCNVLGTHTERQSGAVGGGHRRPFRPGDHGAAIATLERQQVHRRHADEARDKRVGRMIVQLDRRCFLLDLASVQ